MSHNLWLLFRENTVRGSKIIYFPVSGSSIFCFLILQSLIIETVCKSLIPPNIQDSPFNLTEHLSGCMNYTKSNDYILSVVNSKYG